MAQTAMMMGAMIENGIFMIEAQNGTVDSTMIKPTKLPR